MFSLFPTLTCCLCAVFQVQRFQFQNLLTPFLQIKFLRAVLEDLRFQFILAMKLLIFKSFLNLASYNFFLILVVLQQQFLLCGLILFINILVIHSNWQLYFEHHVAHLNVNVIDGTPGYIRSMTWITSQIRVSFSVVTYLVSCVLSSQFSYSYSHSNFW